MIAIFAGRKNVSEEKKIWRENFTVPMTVLNLSTALLSDPETPKSANLICLSSLIRIFSEFSN